MKLLAPDILELTRTLTPLICGVSFAIGLFLWLFGAASHRFWLALLITLTAGLIGLQFGKDFDIQPLVAGLLLALAAGALALSLVRVLLFLMGGAVVLAAVRTLGVGWNELVCFICGGLGGVLLYRWWVTILSSFAGSMLMSYATLSLLDKLGKLQCVPWADRHAPLLNWGIFVLTLLGVLVQFLLERRRRRKAGKKSDKGKPPDSANAVPSAEKPSAVPMVVPAALNRIAAFVPLKRLTRPVRSWISQTWVKLPWRYLPRVRILWPSKT
jgi:hypothetical protein